MTQWLSSRHSLCFLVLVSYIFPQAPCTETKESRFLARLGGGMYCSTRVGICSPHLRLPSLWSVQFIDTAEVFTVSWAATCVVKCCEFCWLSGCDSWLYPTTDDMAYFVGFLWTLLPHLACYFFVRSVLCECCDNSRRTHDSSHLFL